MPVVPTVPQDFLSIPVMLPLPTMASANSVHREIQQTIGVTNRIRKYSWHSPQNNRQAEEPEAPLDGIASGHHMHGVPSGHDSLGMGSIGRLGSNGQQIALKRCYRW